MTIHTFAWAQLPVETLYVSIIPENIASRRVFEKLGFERLHAAEMAQIRIAM